MFPYLLHFSFELCTRLSIDGVKRSFQIEISDSIITFSLVLAVQIHHFSFLYFVYLLYICNFYSFFFSPNLSYFIFNLLCSITLFSKDFKDSGWMEIDLLKYICKSTLHWSTYSLKYMYKSTLLWSQRISNSRCNTNAGWKEQTKQ